MISEVVTTTFFQGGSIMRRHLLLLGIIVSSLFVSFDIPEAGAEENLIKYMPSSELSFNGTGGLLLWCARQEAPPVAVQLTDTVREVLARYLDHYKNDPGDALQRGVQQIGTLPVTRVYFKTRPQEENKIWYIDREAVVSIGSSTRGAGRHRLVISFGVLHDLYESSVVFRPDPLFLSRDQVMLLQESLSDRSVSGLRLSADMKLVLSVREWTPD
jgi:hypothetical protein